ncbi:hypothetical protein QEP73_13760 [Pseudomonas defluvii]|nr:hypothetical protein QEP73_13760 [Pseudomonas defluvii]
MELNELGDFLAGTFGPVAFLWLVLGFLQQGRELKLSTNALSLQAEELKKSVEQQAIMAKTAMQQFDASRKALELQVAEVERTFCADFDFRIASSGGSSPEGTFKNSVSIVNLGSLARDVNLSCKPEFPGFGGASYNVMDANSDAKIELNVPIETDVEFWRLTFCYEGRDGRRRSQSYFCSKGENHTLKFKRAAEMPSSRHYDFQLL